MDKDAMKQAGIVFRSCAINGHSLSDDELNEQISVLDGIISYFEERGDCYLICSALGRELYSLQTMKYERINSLNSVESSED